MLGRRTFAQAMGFFCVFWLIGEIFLGYNRTLMADTFKGNVYFYTLKNGVKILEPTGAQVRVDLIDQGYIYDRVRGISRSGLRIKFSGNTDILKKYGIDQKFMSDDEGGICEPVHTDSYDGGQFFVSGVKPEHLTFNFRYVARHHMSFSKPTNNDINCKQIHVGIVNSVNIHVAFDGLNAGGLVFASLERDSHISFIQRMVMMLRSNPDGELAKFLVKN